MGVATVRQTLRRMFSALAAEREERAQACANACFQESISRIEFRFRESFRKSPRPGMIRRTQETVMRLYSLAALSLVFLFWTAQQKTTQATQYTTETKLVALANEWTEAINRKDRKRLDE